jgi:hypothetical protein
VRLHSRLTNNKLQLFVGDRVILAHSFSPVVLAIH